MRVLIVLQHRYLRTPDGAVWTHTMFPCAYWQRYLDAFSQVRVLTRVQDVPAAPPGWLRADGEGVQVLPLPHYLGPWECLCRARQIRQAALAALDFRDAVILRLPAHQMVSYVGEELRRTGHPYAVEVVADPDHLFAPGGVRHPLRPLLRRVLTRQQRALCAGAGAALYVTQASLQQGYPCPAFTVGISDVEITDDALSPASRPARPLSRARLISIGTMQEMYKGFDVLIKAVAQAEARGAHLQLTLLGDGRYRAELAAQAKALGIDGNVRFTGEVPMGAPVRQYLDDADLFILPSRSEGLPRVLVEAMARALPCLGSAVGGIPELLPPEALVPAGDAGRLAQRITGAVAQPAWLAAMSARNLATARRYHTAVLQQHRVAFLRYVREMTADWLAPSRQALAA